ncbi:MAG: hypothetical protein WB723_02205 [Candidatus Acidiferrales bacterium]
MNRRYLLHAINHTILLVDATPIGLANEVYPPDGKEQSLTSLRFQGWEAAERFLLKAGADPEMLHETRNALKATSLAVLTMHR